MGSQSSILLNKETRRENVNVNEKLLNTGPILVCGRCKGLGGKSFNTNILCVEVYAVGLVHRATLMNQKDSIYIQLSL